MYAALRPRFNTGIALIGAGAVALAPVVVTPPALSPFEQVAAQAVAHDVNLTAVIDIDAALNALGNSVLLGVAVSLDLPDPEVLIDPLESFAANLDALGGAVVDVVAAAFAGNPLEGLAYLASLPVAVITGAVNGLLEGLGDLPGLGDIDLPGVGDAVPALDSVTDVLAAPIQFILNGIETGNVAIAGLLNTGIGGLIGLVNSGLTAGAALLAGALTTGAGFVGGLFGGAADVLVGGAEALDALLADFAALPIIGPPIAAVGDLLGGFANAGATVIDGLGIALTTGAGIVGTLLTNTVTTLTTAIGSAAGLLGAGVSGLSEAFYQALSGVANAIGEFVPGVVPPSPAPPTVELVVSPAASARVALQSQTLRTQTPAGASETGLEAAIAEAAATESASGRPDVADPTPGVPAEAASGVAKDVTDLTAGDLKGADLGKEVSEAASGGKAGGDHSGTPADTGKPADTGGAATADKSDTSTAKAPGKRGGAAKHSRDAA